jgi:hypothetical protein
MPPPAGSVGSDARETWVIAQIEATRINSKEALRISNEALEVSKQALASTTRIETTLGRSPDPAQGIEGTGVLGVLAKQVISDDDEKKWRSRRNAVIGGVAGTLSLIGAVLGVLKALGLLH